MRRVGGAPESGKAAWVAGAALPLTHTKAAGGNRTPNLEITNHALCQLSYGGDGFTLPPSAPAGFTPAARRRRRRAALRGARV